MEKMLVCVCGSEYPQKVSGQAFAIAKRSSFEPTDLGVCYVPADPEVSQKTLDIANALGSVPVAI